MRRTIDDSLRRQGGELTADEIHVWCASMEAPAHRYRGLLSLGERGRAERFRFERDRQRFIVRRGILRTLIGGYLGIEPQQVRFSYGENEKPLLGDMCAPEGVSFNVSHSEGLALFAFALDRRVGVDVEYVGNNLEMEQIVEGFFSDSEKAAFHALPDDQKREAFFRCWTRKEAFIKATGNGLSQGMSGFCVSLSPGEPARLLRVGEDPEAAARWTILDIEPASGFAAALAVEGRCDSVLFRQWPDEVRNGRMRPDDSPFHGGWRRRE